ncbi:hypothetical protein [Paraburkholderia caribensis]|uniref:hypothetical protein n=1 Tax=Paraburkholderia caribensis TaxID=75105 RepID=UPI001D066FB1|nr:hypothetical protein [Paraburkholderia caribensis]
MTSQTCKRINLAREQLEMALDAFLERHRFASAITLASAAERPGTAAHRPAARTGATAPAESAARVHRSAVVC